MALPPRKRQKTNKPAEISFDPNARHEYLTGFHKRKLQRAKHAKEIAAERDRESKIEARKQVSRVVAPHIRIGSF